MNRQNIPVIVKKSFVPAKGTRRNVASPGTAVAFKVCKALTQPTQTVTKAVNSGKIVGYSDQLPANDEGDNGSFKAVQTALDLGKRMKAGSEKVFLRGYQKAVITGTNYLASKENIIENVFEKLGDAEVAAGPSFTGGYYLPGKKQVCTSLFHNPPWSTKSILSQSMDRCKTNHLSFLLLPALHDIGQEKELVQMKMPWYE